MEGYKVVAMMLLVIGLIGSAGPIMMAHGQTFCRMTRSGLKACQFSACGDNPVDPPYKACCDALAQADLPCLCSYKDSGLLKFYNVNSTQAMALPGKCKVGDPSWKC